MKIKYLLLAGLVFLNILCKDKAEKKPDPELSPAYLEEETGWGPADGSYGWYLGFKRQYAILSFQGEGCGEYRGKYTIENKTSLSLRLKTEDPSCSNELKPLPAKCILKATPNSLYFQSKLDCGKHSFFAKSVNPGEERNIGGEPAVTMGMKKATLDANMRVRAQPNTEGKIIKCSLEGDIEKRKVLPRGKEIVLLARTKDKQKVGKHEAYWYYSDLQVDWYGDCDKNTGWIFGQWISIQNKPKT